MLGSSWILPCFFKLGFDFSVRLPLRWPNCWVNVVAFLVPVFLSAEAVAWWLELRLELSLLVLAASFLGGISLGSSPVNNSERSAERPKR